MEKHLQLFKKYIIHGVYITMIKLNTQTLEPILGQLYYYLIIGNSY